MFIMIALMLVGGSPGSMAGGMKTTTFAVRFVNHKHLQAQKNSEMLGRLLKKRTVCNLCSYTVPCFSGGGSCYFNMTIFVYQRIV